jgi:predicted PolB exonuclease-like 3'-5' exonuclease
MKRLFLDIETSPNLVLSWRTGYKINIDSENIIKERAIICVCYKWENEKTVKFIKWDKNQNDKKIIEQIIPVLDEADELVGHNIEAFDLAWIKTRAIYYGIITSPHYKCIDTLLFARKRLYFNSNKLEYLARYLGVGGKIKTEFNLWKRITLENHKPSLDKMVIYCKMDVLLLERVYHRLQNHMVMQTHAGVLNGLSKWTCPKCSSSVVHTAKTRITAQGTVKKQMACNKCGHTYTISQTVWNGYNNLTLKKKKRKFN